MIFLNTTTKSLRIVLADAVTTNQIVFSVNYIDINTDTLEPLDIAEVNGVSNDTTAVEILEPPIEGFVRQVKQVTLFNNDTVPATIQVFIDDNSITVPQVEFEVPVKDSLLYIDTISWKLLNSVLGALAYLNTVGTSQIDDGAVTLAKQANLAEATMIGRALAAGTGVPQALTPSQIRALLVLATTNMPEFAGLNIGHASDTTVTRGEPGQLNVEGSRVFQRNNILGTVSEASGVPTGSVFQSGADFVRYANGTQICNISANMTYNSADDLRYEWTYPVPFSSTPVANHTPNSNTGIGLTNAKIGATNCDIISESTTSVILRAVGNGVWTGGNEVWRTRGIAIGRWYEL